MEGARYTCIKKDISKNHQDFFYNLLKKRRRSILIAQISLLIIGIALWETAAQLKWIDTFLTSSPSAIWKLFIEYTLHGKLFHHVGISVLETLVGFFCRNSIRPNCSYWTMVVQFLGKGIRPLSSNIK